MKPTKIGLLALVSLLLTAPALAQSFADDTPGLDEQEFPFDAPPATITTDLLFSVTGEANATVELAADLIGYTAELLLSDDGENFTTVATGVNDTTPSTELLLNGSSAFRAVITVPAGTKTADTTDSFGFIVTLDNTANEGGNGATQNPTLAHVLDVYWYDPATDSDGDGLPDDWETENFGDLTANGDQDSDADTYTNREEYEAGTDPNDDASVPRHTVVSAGGSDFDDREIGNVVAGILVFTIVLAFSVWGIKGVKMERMATKIAVLAGFPLFIAILVVAALDKWALDDSGFAWWNYFDMNWVDFVATAAALIAVFGAGTVAFMKLNEKKEVHAGWAMIAAAIIVAGGAWLLFGYFDIHLPVF